MISQREQNLVVIPDIHGCMHAFSNSLESANNFIANPAGYLFPSCSVDKLPQFFNDSVIVLLGDLLDRGPESFQVIDFLQKLSDSHYLCGNHEAIFFKFLYQDDPLTKWSIDHDSMLQFFLMGGMKTLRSFVESGKFLTNSAFVHDTVNFRGRDLGRILSKYNPFIADLRCAIRYNSQIQSFFTNMHLSIQFENILCVHAGFLPEYLKENLGLPCAGWIQTLNAKFRQAVLDGINNNDCTLFDTFTSVSRLRNGDSYPGPLWADRREVCMMTDVHRQELSKYYEIENIDTVIVGHSIVDNVSLHNLAFDVSPGFKVKPIKFIFADTGISSHYKTEFDSQALVLDKIGNIYYQDQYGDFDMLGNEDLED